MTEFWENSFLKKREMWGFEPARSAMLAKDLFVANNIKNVLIPGIGYGRNAQPFLENKMAVTGIEISGTAIEMAQRHFGTGLTIYHGSVNNMPYDKEHYEGIFCYALIHLLDAGERDRLIRSCYHQLSDNGYMIFTAITQAAQTYGQGRQIGKDRFEMFGGATILFYDRDAIRKAFGPFGLLDIKEVREHYPFYFIVCRKTSNPSKPATG